MTTPREIMKEVAPGLAELTVDVLFGDVWERPGLSKRDRSLITVATLIALYRTGQLPGHIGEVITHMAFYAGWPTAAQASKIAKDVFDAR